MADDNAALIAALRGQDAAAMQPETFANPAVSNALGALATLPKRAIENSQFSLDTGTYDPSVPMEAATSLAGVGAPAAEAGAAGIFGGKLAKTADIEKLIFANKMKELGRSPSDIWKETGWFKSIPDQKWKFEIPDDAARVVQHGLDYTKDGNFVSGPSAAIFDHPELYKAYPELGNYPMYNTVLQKPLNEYGRGSFTPATKTVEVEAPNLKNATGVGLHEMQHAVQNLENFQQGGNPSFMAKLQEQTPEKLPLHEWKSDPRDMYQRLAGEVEARNVTDRWEHLPSEIRSKITPWQSHDVVTNQQLVYDPKHNIVRALRHLK